MDTFVSQTGGPKITLALAGCIAHAFGGSSGLTPRTCLRARGWVAPRERGLGVNRWTLVSKPHLSESVLCAARA